jgi:hypothetical protein
MDAAYHPSQMVVITGPTRARWAAGLRLVVLIGVALLSAHSTIFVAQYGTGAGFADAMDRGGHDGWWVAVGTIVLLIGGLALIQVLGGLGRLEIRARRSAGRRERGLPSYRTELLAIWRRLFPSVVVLFAVQENLEHVASQGHWLGLGALAGPEYPLALPILALVTVGLAAFGAVIRWRTAVLRLRLAGNRHRTSRRPSADLIVLRWRTVGALAPRAWLLDRLDAGRSPPRAFPV